MIDDLELRDLLRTTAQSATLPSEIPEPLRRRVTRRRARTVVVAALAGVAIVAGGLQGVRSLGFDDAASDESAGRPDAAVAEGLVPFDLTTREARPAAPAPKVPYLIDLESKQMTPLPDTIVESLADGHRFERMAGYFWRGGSSLSFVGEDAAGRPQIFLADLDGTGMRQLTHDPRRATSPAWSPDGTHIAYEGFGSGDNLNVFVVEVATGETRAVLPPEPSCVCNHLAPQFTPDGSAIIFTGGSPSAPAIVRAPLRGGPVTTLLDDLPGLADAGNAALSPDGRLITFTGSGFPFPGYPDAHCGPCRLLANADGSNLRAIPGWIGSPAGTWSHDGTRLVTADGEDVPSRIVVYDVTTEEALVVADGRAAIWIDDDTLLVDR